MRVGDRVRVSNPEGITWGYKGEEGIITKILSGQPEYRYPIRVRFETGNEVDFMESELEVL